MTSTAFALATAVACSILASGCGVKVGFTSAQAGTGALPAEQLDNEKDQTALFENQLMRSYSQDAMADFILEH